MAYSGYPAQGYGQAQPMGYPQAGYPYTGYPAYPAYPAYQVDPSLNLQSYGLAYNPYDFRAWSDPSNFKTSEASVYNFTPDEFQKLRNHKTKESALEQLREIGCDCATVPIELFTQPIARVCFCCVNTYTSQQKQLGVGPLCDAITVGANHRLMGYFVYYLHNPKPKTFMAYLEMFLRITTENLTVYYTGHGSQVADKSGDEADGMDEVMVFDDGFIVDDDLAGAVKRNCSGQCKVLLLNDCCRSGTIWDVPEDIKVAERTWPANVLSMSAAKDSQTAKQTKGLGKVAAMQGLFTFNLFQNIRTNRKSTPRQLQVKLTSQLKQYKQDVQVSVTRRELLDQPLFPLQ